MNPFLAIWRWASQEPYSRGPQTSDDMLLVCLLFFLACMMAVGLGFLAAVVKDMFFG